MSRFALLLFVLCWFHVALADLPSVVIIKDSAAFIDSIVELAQLGRTSQVPAASQTLLLTQDIRVEPADWPPETLSNPLILGVNVTVLGSVPGKLAAYPVLDLSW
jgi:hypothetical protein